MDNCNIFDFHIENDSDNRLKNFVKDAIESQQERIIIADKINNGKLQQWAINHKIIKDASEIRTLNGNTFKKLVVDYMNVGYSFFKIYFLSIIYVTFFLIILIIS